MKRSIRTSLLALGLLLTAASHATAQTTTFSYQGSMNTSGSPANGNFDFEFAAFDLASGGIQIGSTLTRTNVAVANGTFTVTLDFGNIFGGSGSRFLEVRARPAGGGGYTTLSPRTQIVASPFAIRAIQADSSAFFGGQPASFYLNASNQVAGTLADARLSGNIPRLNSSNSFLGGIQVDNNDQNNGTVGLNTVRFGGGATGEGIGSRRTPGANQWGLDIYTASVPRVAITNSGNVGIGTQSPSATLDVNGNVNADNLPAFKGTQTFRDPRNINSALVIPAGTFGDVNSISVNVPAAGTLLITATANIETGDFNDTTFTTALFKLEETTSGSPVMLTEVGNFSFVDSAFNVTIRNGATLTISWTVPVAAAGTRSFKTAVTMPPNPGNFQARIFSSSLNVLYIGKGM